MKLKIAKSIKRTFAVMVSIVTIFSLFTALPFSKSVTAADSIIPTLQFNHGSELISESFLTDTDNGYMRVFYDGEKVRIEYYDNSFNILSKKSVETELEYWGGFYKGSNAYFILEGCSNLSQDDDAEVIRVTKYDNDWNKLGSASITPDKELFGGDVRYPFDYAGVQMTERDGTLYIVTGHQGYVDDTIGQGHQGFLMIAVDEETMTGKIVQSDLWHSFAQYIDYEGTDLYVLEQSEGSRCTKVTKYDASDPYLNGDTVSVLEYGGVRTSARGIVCYASVDGLSVSDKNVLCLGTSIDQSEYDEVDKNTSHNIYLTVTPKSDFTEETTKVRWLTDYSDDGKSFVGTKMTKINDNRFLITWEEYYPAENELKAADSNDLLSTNTLHYIFIDGAGNKISKEFVANAAISDCQPILKDSKVIFYTSGSTMMNFYMIDAATGEFNKKVYRIAGENVSWELVDGTMIISGTGAIDIDTERHLIYPISTVSYSYSYSSDDTVWNPIKDKVSKIVVKEGITSISDKAFMNIDALKEVKIDEGLENIGDEAFSSCSSLSEVIIPSGVKSIGKEAFAYTNAMSEVTIPSSVTSIGEDAFWSGFFVDSEDNHLVFKTLYAAAGSYTEEYAKANNIRFVDVNYVGITDIRISKSEITLEKGESETLMAIITPENATDKTLVWSSNDESVAIVSDGKITAVGTGTAVIDAVTPDYSYSDCCYVTVIVKGDANGDEKVNIADALMISRYDAGLTWMSEYQLSVSDVNGDGKVNIADALVISRYDAGLIDKL